MPPLLAAFGCTEPPAGPPPAEAARPPPHVVVMVTDGVRPEECFESGPHPQTGEPMEEFFPELRALLPEAALVRRGLQSLVTKTQPAHATLLTGTHLPYGHYAMLDGFGNHVPEVPTLLHALGGRGVLVSNTSQVHGVAASLYPGADAELEWVSVSTGTDAGVVDVVAELVRTDDLALIVANLHEADRAGHRADEPADYTEVAKLLDAPLAALWETIQSTEGWAGNTVLAVVADHGRHVEEVTSGFRSHGDACSGCRQIPMLFLGPGVPGGRLATDHRWDLADVAPTLAGLAGVELPFADGLPIDEIVEAPARGGVQERVLGAWVELGADPDTRRVVVAGGEVVSDTGAVDARGPVAAVEGGTPVAWCWRELPRVDGMPGSWVERCRRADGAELGWPEAEVSPYLVPGLAVQDGALVAFFEDNPTGIAGDEDKHIDLVLARTDGEGWTVAGLAIETHFPQWPTVRWLGGDRFLLAWTGGDDGATARDHRDLHLQAVEWPATGDSVPGPLTLVASEARHERVALWNDGDEVVAAWIREDLAEVVVEVAASADGGLTWSDAETVSGTSAIPVVRPVYTDEGELLWAEIEGGLAVVHGLDRSGAMRTAELGVARVEGLYVDDGTIGAVVDTGVGQWEARPVW